MDMPDAPANFYKGMPQKALWCPVNIIPLLIKLYPLILYNEENNADWVMVMVYNKWTYNDGVRDSALYWDNWRLKDGRIVYLNSLAQAPPKTLLKTLETKLE
jgi:hypothetical protein